MEDELTKHLEDVKQNAARLINGDTLVVSQRRHPAGSNLDTVQDMPSARFSWASVTCKMLALCSC
jgi:hypothetical protein